MVTAFLFASRTYRLLLFAKFNTKIFSFSMILCKKCIFAPSLNLNQRIMNKEDEGELLRWLQDKDVSEVMSLLMKHGNRYSRRILKFFRWFCKYVPIIIMCFHAYGMWNFSRHPREMFIPYVENTPCYLYIYFMVYILPMVIILASRLFFLCWRYRIPFSTFLASMRLI